MKATKRVILFSLFITLIFVVHIAKADTELTVKPSGNVYQRCDNELRGFAHSNMEPTGLYLKKGEKIIITASDVTKAKVFLGLIGTYHDYNEGKEVYKEEDLKNGLNEFTMESDIGKVYIENLSETDNLKVSIVGGRQNPIYILGETTDSDFMKSLNSDKESPFFELVGDHVHGLFKTSKDNIDALNKRDSVKSLVEYLDGVVVSESQANGLYFGSKSLGSNYKSDNRIYMINCDNVAGAAGNRVTYFSDNFIKDILSYKPGDDLWGLWHEFGHTYQNPYMKWQTDGDPGEYPGYSLGEVTVNINSLYVQHRDGLQGRIYGEPDQRKNIQTFLTMSNKDKDFDTASAGDFKPDTDTSCWIKQGFYNQLMLAYGYDIFAYVNQEYRTMYATGQKMPSSNEEKRQCFMEIVSKVTSRNLTDYFKKWGLHPDASTKEAMERYHKPTVPIENNLLPGYDEAIVDNEVQPLEVPTVTPKKAKFVLGAQPRDYQLSDLVDGNSYKNLPSGKTFSPSTNIVTTNDLLENSGVSVELTNESGVTNVIKIPVEKSYGNSISMVAYGSEERAIFTLQKSSRTFETFTNESQTTVLDSGNGTFVTFKLFDSAGNLKQEASCKREEAPQNFIHSLRNIPYEEGDVVELIIDNGGKLQSYKGGKIDLNRADSGKKELFKIENDQFIHLSSSDASPKAEENGQNIKIGEASPQASRFVKNVMSVFGAKNVEITFDKQPSVNEAGEKVITITLRDKILDVSTKITSKLNVKYDNALALAAYSPDDIRSVLRLDATMHQWVGFANSDRTTAISGSNSKYWELKVIRNGEIIKTLSTLGTDQPFDFAKSINGFNYQEGDILSLYAQQKFIENYHNSVLVNDQYNKNNYFKIENDQFVHVTDSDPTLDIKNNHLLYEESESLTESNFLKEAQASTDSASQLTTDFEPSITKSLGDHTINITATNPVNGETISKSIVVTIVKPSFSISGTLHYTNGNDKLQVGKPKEVELNISGQGNQTSSATKISLAHHFEAKDLTLGSSLQQKRPGETWESSMIDPSQPLNLTVDQLKDTEEYLAKYDILASKEMSIQNGEQWQVEYSYINEGEGVQKTYTKKLDLDLSIDAQESSDDEQATKVSKKGSITFKDDNQPVNPVDPVDPDVPVDPVNPINPSGAELMITYASNLDFGNQLKTQNNWHALADTVKISASSDSTRSIVPFVSVKDSRGTERKGWVLEATKDDDFKDEDGNILPGASLTLSNLNYADRQNAPVATEGSVELNNEAVVIAKADAEQGSGVSSLAFGQLQKEKEKTRNDKVSRSDQLVDKTAGVTLSVLPGSIVNSKNYTTSITYELVAGV